MVWSIFASVYYSCWFSLMQWGESGLQDSGYVHTSPVLYIDECITQHCVCGGTSSDTRLGTVLACYKTYLFTGHYWVEL